MDYEPEVGLVYSLALLITKITIVGIGVGPLEIGTDLVPVLFDVVPSVIWFGVDVGENRYRCG